MTSTPATDRAALRFALGVAGSLLCVVFAILGPHALTAPDDAIIVVTYVKHLVNNGVIAWNIHDGHVDGCTSILDLLMKAAVYRVTNADPVRIVFWVTIVLHLLLGPFAVVVLARLTRAWPPLKSLGLATVAALILTSSPALADGASFLLETPLFVLVGLALVAIYLLRTTYPPWMLALLVLDATAVWMARPEGLALSTAFVILILFEQRKALSAVAIAATFFAFLGLMATYFAWHIHYFGYWAPNTYYAKASDSRWNEIQDGWSYVIAYLRSSDGFEWIPALVVSPLAVLASQWSSPRARWQFAVLQATVLGSLAIVVYSGGDGYSGGRLLAMPAALSAVGLAVGIFSALGVPRQLLVVSAVVLVAIQVFTILGYSGTSIAELRKWPVRSEYFDCPRRMTNALRHAIPRGTAAEADFQTLKYLAEDLEVIDLHGLNDQKIAHRPEPDHVLWGKFRYEDALDRLPDAWFWGHHTTSPTPMSQFTTRDLITDHKKSEFYAGLDYVPEGALADRMVSQYVPASYEACDRWYNVLVRKDLVQKFQANGFQVGSAE